jgi:putative membrane protein
MTMKPLSAVLLAALLVATWATPSHAQAQTSHPPAPQTPAPKTFSGPGGLGAADIVWIQQKAHGTIFDFEASRLAAKQAQSKQVRTFAKTIMDDDSSSGQMLSTIAKANEVLLPEHPDAAQQAELDRLTSLHGDAFDAAYLKDMRTAYQDDLAAERTEAGAVTDRALMKFVRHQQATDRTHARSAAQLQGTGTAVPKG